LQEISISGEAGEVKTYAWKGELSEFASVLEESDKKERPFYVFFHDAIVDKNGHIFLIGEQFLKQVSAGGIALNALTSAAGGSSNASMFEMLIGNMIVFEFNEKKEIVEIKSVDKKRTKVILPAGMGVYGSSTLGYYIKGIGAFDYSFTSRNKEKDMYDIVYIDANRKEDSKSSGKSDLMVGVISIKQGKMKENRIPINCDSYTWWIQPGKPGFISVSEYNRKTRTINMRLEKLTY
jgi:hypothetical protein